MGTSFFAPRVAGFGLASEMLLTGRLVTAERAYQVCVGPRGAENTHDICVYEQSSCVPPPSDLLPLTPPPPRLGC